jgi:hypothetical protein
LALRCCAGSGCWKSRTKPLGDGEDTEERLCTRAVNCRVVWR